MNSNNIYDESVSDRLNDILDKISKNNILYLTTNELDFLNSYKDNNEDKAHNILISNERTFLFDDFDENFKFYYKGMEVSRDQTIIYGTICVPDLELEDGKFLDGCIKGKIKIKRVGNKEEVTIKFKKRTYDIFEFCKDKECELDMFIDYIISELLKKTL